MRNIRLNVCVTISLFIKQKAISLLFKSQLTNSYESEQPDIEYPQSRRKEGRKEGRYSRRKAVGSIFSLFSEHLPLFFFFAK